MSKDPAVLFYTSDFLSGTLTMSNEQKGKYITLLCLQHQQGGITHEDMLNICKSYDAKVFGKFVKEGDLYFNERMRFESEKRKNYSASRSLNRKICNSYDKHMENENENINKDEYVISNLLLSEILKRKPDLKKPDIEKWAKNIDLMIRVDKRKPEEIKKVVVWCQQDSFWQNNILSTEKLRKQYDQLTLKMRGGNNGTGNATFKRQIRTERDAINQAACDEADRIAQDYYAKHPPSNGHT